MGRLHVTCERADLIGQTIPSHTMNEMVGMRPSPLLSCIVDSSWQLQRAQLRNGLLSPAACSCHYCCHCNSFDIDCFKKEGKGQLLLRPTALNSICLHAHCICIFILYCSNRKGNPLPTSPLLFLSLVVLYNLAKTQSNSSFKHTPNMAAFSVSKWSGAPSLTWLGQTPPLYSSIPVTRHWTLKTCTRDWSHRFLVEVWLTTSHMKWERGRNWM